MEQQRIEYWLSTAQEDLERDGNLTYSPMFRSILEAEDNGYYIASELARLLISEYARHEKYQLTVGVEFLIIGDYSLKEITIKTKP